jgi:hypothetical protein
MEEPGQLLLEFHSGRSWRNETWTLGGESLLGSEMASGWSQTYCRSTFVQVFSIDDTQKTMATSQASLVIQRGNTLFHKM